MDAFVKTFSTIKIPPSVSDNPIVVALLDDGRIRPYWASEIEHGTLMARLIHRLCPKAIIKVFKLRTEFTENSKLQIIESSAIEAINDAVSMNVDIISMSWTLKSQDREAFYNAIHGAAQAKILTFCASSDTGRGEDTNYPYNCSPNETFMVGAVKASGQIWEWVPNIQALDMGLPGHDVLMKDELPHENDFKLDSHTGFSVATALATGLAALILTCVRLGKEDCAENAGEPDLKILENDCVNIQTKEGMMKAFK